MQVAPIISAVQERGDAAVREYTSKFDQVDLEAVCVPIEDIPMPSLPAHIEASFDIAYQNIYNFHKAQETSEVSVDTMPGVTCRQVQSPFTSATRTASLLTPLQLQQTVTARSFILTECCIISSRFELGLQHLQAFSAVHSSAMHCAHLAEQSKW
jgi:hypothetical protein